MDYLTWLEPVITARLAAIGQPVFVRANLELTADHGLQAAVAAAGLEGAAKWIGSAPRSLYAQGGPKAGYVSLLVEFVNGATALISAEAAHGEPAAHLLVTGQLGTLRYDDVPEPGQLRDAPAAGRDLTAWIGESLASGKPVVRS